MTHVAMQIDIDAPLDQVFDFVADFRNALRYMAHFQSFQPLTEHTYGPGATVRAVGKLHGFPISTELQIVGFQKNRHLSSISRRGIRSFSRWIFDPLDGGTRVTFVADYHLTGLAVAAKVLGKLLDESIRASTKVTLRNLKRELETSRDGRSRSGG